MAKPTLVEVKKLKEAEVETLVRNVENLEAALESWREAGIPRNTLVVLLNHYTKVPQRTIRLVMEGMDALHEEYFTEEEDDDD